MTMSPNESGVQRYKLEQRKKASANWFYWIAGLSIVNSVAVHAGSSWSFIAGLGLTQVIDALGAKIGSSGAVIALVLDVLAAGVFVLLGYLARTYNAVFVIGLALYALDALIFLFVGQFIGVLFHVLVLYWIFSGFRAARELARLPGAASPAEPFTPTA
jgi:hypothetical protein